MSTTEPKTELKTPSATTLTTEPRPETVQVGDKVFERFLREEIILAQIENIAEQINEDLKDKNPLFVVILNGAMIFASDLYRRITIPSEFTSTRLKSYDGTLTTGTVKTLIPLTEDVAGRTVVVVEDIVDSGRTIERITQQLRDLGAADVRTAILLFKEEACQLKNPPITYCCFTIPDKFVVGYGLDYNEGGRGWRDIYTLATGSR